MLIPAQCWSKRHFLKYALFFIFWFSEIMFLHHADAKSSANLGQEFLINSMKSARQWNASVAKLSENRFFVCWESKFQDGDASGIFGQLFDSNGEKIGNEIQINTQIVGDQIRPRVSAADNCFAVIWETEGATWEWMGINMRIFDFDADPLTDEFIFENEIRRSVADDQFAIAGLKKSNKFAIAWHPQAPDEYIRVRMCTAKGELQKDVKIDVLMSDSNFWASPEIASFYNDEFLVCFHQYTNDESEDANYSSIWLQRFNSTGEKEGEPIKVISSSQNHSTLYPNLSIAESGTFVVGWLSAEKYSGYFGAICCQTFSPTGLPLSDIYTVEQGKLYNQSVPSILFLNNNHVFVTWSAKTDNTDETEIFAQMVRLDGTKYSRQLQLNDYTTSWQFQPTACQIDNDKFFVVWDSYDQDGSSQAVIGEFLPTAPRALKLKPFSITMPQLDSTIDSTGLWVEWSEASDLPAIYSCEMNYTLYYSQNEDFKDFGTVQTGERTNAFLQKLQKGKSYYLKVCAENINSEPLWSSITSAFFISHNARGEESSEYNHIVLDSINCEWIDDAQWIRPDNPSDSTLQSAKTISLFDLKIKPNPFNALTTIKFELPADGNVKLSIYNTSGKTVAVIARGETIKGVHTFTWRGKDDGGHDCASGIYFYRLEFWSGDGSKTILTKKMSLVR